MRNRPVVDGTDERPQGPPQEVIPSVNDPEFGPGYDGDPDDLVIALDGATTRAYPVRVLDFYEVVSDGFEGRPVAVTWCPLCGSGVVYDRRVGGRTLSFGVSGKLADDDLVLYDRETESEWKQSLDRAIAGPLEGAELDVLPARTMRNSRFRECYPDGLVLRPPGGESEAASDTDEPAPIDYDARPYRDYLEGEGFGLGGHRGTGSRAWGRSDLPPKAVVLGVEHDGEALGFRLPRVAESDGVACTSVGGLDVVAFAAAGGAAAFEDPGHEWARARRGAVSADGALWDPTTGEGDDGRRLAPVAARRPFAFT
jgi:hypothetical protein